jgi:hypothetical protein
MPPPPPPPPPLTDQDLQLYGVVVAGNVKRATVRVGGRLTSMQQNGRAFITIGEGQALGEYSVASIEPSQIVLAAQGTRQTVVFTKKNDRPAAVIVPPVIQAASTPAASPAAPVPPLAVAGQVAPMGGAAPASPAGAIAGPGSAAVTGSPAPASGNSLADAIAAAQAAARAGGGAAPAPAPNPFLPR